MAAAPVIVLGAADGHSVGRICEELGCSHATVAKWRARFMLTCDRSDPLRRGRIAVTVVLQTLAALLMLACFVPAAHATILWKADAEALMAEEWASTSSEPVAASPPNPDSTRIAQNEFRAQGSKSYRFEIRAGDDSWGARAELGQAMPALASYQNRWFRAGEERWIAMQYYLPNDWPTATNWQSLLQIKPVSPGGGGSTIGIVGDSNMLRFSGTNNVWGSTRGDQHYGSGPLATGGWPLTRGKWIKLTFHIVFSADPAVGKLEIFGDLADGQGMKTLAPLRSTATMKYLTDGITMDPVHLRVGIYRDPLITTTQSMYVDGVTVATTRAAAEENAYGPPPPSVLPPPPAPAQEVMIGTDTAGTV